MKTAYISPASETHVALEKDLQHELETWYDLLKRFYGYHDDELEFDIEAAGDEGRSYISMLEELQEEAARSIAIIKSRVMTIEATAISLRELKKISSRVRQALRERERLRILGSNALSEMLAIIH